MLKMCLLILYLVIELYLLIWANKELHQNFLKDSRNLIPGWVALVDSGISFTAVYIWISTYLPNFHLQLAVVNNRRGICGKFPNLYNNSRWFFEALINYAFVRLWIISLHICFDSLIFADCTEHTKIFMLLCMIKKLALTKLSLEGMKTMVRFLFSLDVLIDLINLFHRFLHDYSAFLLSMVRCSLFSSFFFIVIFSLKFMTLLAISVLYSWYVFISEWEKYLLVTRFWG